MYTLADYSDPAQPNLTVYMEKTTASLQVIFTVTDPASGNTATYHCEGAACSGITPWACHDQYGLHGPDTPLLLRDVTLDQTPLAGINVDGTPTNTTATLISSFTTDFYDNPYNFTWPVSDPPTPCSAGADAVAMTVNSGQFNFCSAPPHGSTVQSNGDVMLSIDNNTDPNNCCAHLNVVLHTGTVSSVTYDAYSQYGADYSCYADCTGVSVTQNASNQYVVTFTNTGLHIDLQLGVTGPGFGHP